MHTPQPRHTVTAELLIEATRLVVRDQSASVTRIQRRCYVGFATASRLLERMEQLGVVSAPVERTHVRDVLVRPDDLDIVVEEIRAAARAAESDSHDVQTPGHQDSAERPPAAATATGAAKPATTT